MQFVFTAFLCKTVSVDNVFLFGCSCYSHRVPSAYENFTELMKILQPKNLEIFVWETQTKGID